MRTDPPGSLPAGRGGESAQNVGLSRELPTAKSGGGNSGIISVQDWAA
jgi:hypothetical protein